jgi:predicted esterase
LHLKEYLSDKKQYLYYGDEDKYLTEATMDGIRKVIKKNELNVSIHQFEGEHKIPKEELIAFNKKYVET